MQVKGKYLELRLEKSDVLERLEAECGEEDLETIINNGTLKLEDADLHGNFYKILENESPFGTVTVLHAICGA
jgi:hypothetical protein